MPAPGGMWKGGVVVHIVAKSLLQYAAIDS